MQLFLNKKLYYIYAFLGVFLLLFAVRSHVDRFTAGDEPHYLVMDYSLIHDKDLDLKNNYQNKDYFRYYPEEILPHVSPLNTNDESSGWYSFHGAALPVLMAPFFLVSESKGHIIFMLLIATSVILLTYVWTLRIIKNKKASLITSGLLLACYFFNGLAGYIYPDLAVAALTLVAFILLEGLYKSKKNQFLFGLSLGMLVLLHFRTLILAFPLGLMMWYKLWREGTKIPFALFGGALPLVALFFGTLYAWFGVLTPNKIYFSSVSVGNSLFNTIPAILFDSIRGILVYNPILILIFVGLPIWMIYKRESFKLLIALIPTIIVASSFNEWQGGYSPSGRYFMAFIPVLMPAIGFVLLQAHKSWQKAVVGLLAGATVLISLMAIYIKMQYPVGVNRSEMFIKIENATGVPFDRILPTYSLESVPIDRFGALQALGGMLIVLACLLYGYYIARQSKNGSKNPKKRKA